MKRLLVPLALLAIAAALLPAAVPPVYACTCEYFTPEQHTQQADLIVVGVVKDVGFTGPIDEIGSQLAPGQGTGDAPGVRGEVTIQVQGYLKGTGADVLVVEQGVQGVFKDIEGNVKVSLVGEATCGLFGGQPLDERYLLFLQNYEPGIYSTTICSSMRLHPASDTPPYAGYAEDYTARLAKYDTAFGLPPGTLVNIANAPGPFSLPPGGGPPGAVMDAPSPWLPITLAAGAAALLAAELVQIHRVTPV